jgi:hypothetical protein
MSLSLPPISPKVDFPGVNWMTSFLDTSSPRHGVDDVSFVPVAHPVPYFTIIVGVFVLVFMRRINRQSRAAARAARQAA